MSVHCLSVPIESPVVSHNETIFYYHVEQNHINIELYKNIVNIKIPLLKCVEEEVLALKLH